MVVVDSMSGLSTTHKTTSFYNEVVGKSKTKSTWSPVVHKPSNSQIYQERVDLIGHWFDLWTTKQRKNFMLSVFSKCSVNELNFVQNFVQGNISLKKVDFTTVLPKRISLEIFKLLDPKTLSICANVSSQWNRLSEDDNVWIQKCVKFGWYLQYSPSNLEHGAWKRHYIRCYNALHKTFVETAKHMSETSPDELFQIKIRDIAKEKRNVTPRPEQIAIEDRPRWQDPDKTPRDIHWRITPEEVYNPNFSASPRSAFQYSKRFGMSTFLSDKMYGLNSSLRQSGHSLTSSLNGGTTLKLKPSDSKETLTNLLHSDRIENGTSFVVETPIHQVSVRNSFSEMYTIKDYKTIKENNIMETTKVYPHHENPRVLYISSNIIAKELLLRSVMFGVIPIVYDFDSVTPETLLTWLGEILNKRLAKSIGFFVDGDAGELNICKGSCMTHENIDNPENTKFWRSIVSNMVVQGLGGHIDIFNPLASCENGMDLLFKLSNITEMQYSTPVNMVGSNRVILGEWLKLPEGIKPVSQYFQYNDLLLWIATAERVQESLYTARRHLGGYYDNEEREIVEYQIGKLVFDALGMSKMKSITASLVPSIVDAVMAYEKDSSCVGEFNAELIDFVSKFLKKKVKTLNRKTVDKAVEIKEQELKEPNTGDGDAPATLEISNCNADESDLEEESWYDKQNINIKAIEDLLCLTYYEKKRVLGILKYTKVNSDRRTTIAIEMLSVESEYMRSLTILTDVFMKQLRLAIDTNKPIIGIGNVHTLFQNIVNLQEVSQTMVRELIDKIDGWTSQSTLSDILLKLSGRAKVYTNFINNYPTILQTYDYLIENNPAFRAFIKFHEKTARTKMLSFIELYLLPTQQISKYILILEALDYHTAANHADKRDIKIALTKLTSLNDFILENKLKAERDRRIFEVEAEIINCPKLLEGNRQFIRKDFVALLKPRASDCDAAHLKVYDHIQDLSLYLFNDSIVFTVVELSHTPFERIVKKKIHFSLCVSIMKIELIPIINSSFVQNSAILRTKKSSWCIKFSSRRDLLSFIDCFEHTIKSCVNTD